MEHRMHSVTNPLQACNDIFFKPNGVFKAVGENNNWSWLPFILLVVALILPQYLYANFVDIDWLADTMIASQEAMSPAEEDAMRSFITRTSLIVQATVGTLVALVVFNAIFAVYFNLATRSDDSHVFGFTDWYGFTWWISMPSILSCLIAVVLILLADSHQLPQSTVSPTSLAYLFNIDVASSWFAFCQALRVEMVWSIYLTMVGISQWTSFSTKKSLAIAVAPSAVIYGIWLIILLL